MPPMRQVNCDAVGREEGQLVGVGGGGAAPNWPGAALSAEIQTFCRKQMIPAVNDTGII